MHDALKFLEFMYDEGDLITFRPIKNWYDNGERKGRVILTEWKTFAVEEMAKEFPKYYQFCEKEKTNAFYGVCPRFGRRTEKTSFEKRWQIRKANFFWLDIDYLTPEEAVDRIEQAGVPEPSVIVSTGNGVHCYWRLENSLKFAQQDPPVLEHMYFNDKLSVWYVDENDQYNYFTNAGVKLQGTPVPDVCEDALMVEDINCGLGKLLDGDNTNDVSRILRLPGTNNYKDPKDPKPCSIYAFSGKKYKVEDFQFALDVSPSRIRREATRKMSLPDPSITAKQLGANTKRGKKLQTFLDDLRVVGEGERSDVDWKLMCWVVEEAIDPEYIWTQVEDLSKFGVRGRQYFDTTLANAQMAVKQKRWDDAQERQAKVEADMDAAQNEKPGLLHFEKVTDVKVAEMVAADHKGEIYFCDDAGGWLAYSSGKFVEEMAGVVVQQSIIDSVRKLPAKLTGGDNGKQQVVMEYESGSSIATLERLLRKTPQTAGTIGAFDCDPYLLNVGNGTIDLSGNVLAFREHSPGDFLTKQANVMYDPDAVCPLWEDFLRTILVDPETREPSDELYDFMQVYLGTFLTGLPETGTIGILWGTGANGKSTLTETILGVLGDYGTSPHSDMLLKKNSNATETAAPTMMTLRGARFVSCQELDRDKQLDEAGVKSLTGKDEMKARPLYGKPVKWKPSHQIVLSTNNKPTISGGDAGIWRRIRLIPFLHQIPEDEQDGRMQEKLIAEASGILNWLLTGYRKFRENGLVYPDIVEEATQGFKGDSDIIGQFIDEKCSYYSPLGDTKKVPRVPKTELFDAYCEFAQSNREELIGRNSFYKAIDTKGFVEKKYGGVRHFTGIRLLTPIELQIREEIARGEGDSIF